MLHIIGFVLKCIGILLAVLLAVSLLLLGIVLFVPLRYEGEGQFPGKIEEITGRVKMTWFFHLVRADAIWQNGEFSWNVRAAWKKFNGETSEKKVMEDAEDVATATKEAADVPENLLDEEPEREQSETQDSEQQLASSSSKGETLKEEKTKRQKDENRNKKVSLWGRIKKKFRKFLEWIKCTFRKICDKIKEGTELKDRILAFLQDESHKSAYARGKKEFIWLKRFFKVKKGHITLRFGFEDPSLTGKILGILGILYPLVNGNLYVTPEFEEECLEGQIDLKGQMRLIHLVIFVIRMVLDRNVRQTYKDVIEWKDS